MMQPSRASATILGATRATSSPAAPTAGFLDQRLAAAVPDLTRGFDPLALYGFGADMSADGRAFAGSPTR